MKTTDLQFDFSLVGKRMPYTVPEGFLEQSAATMSDVVSKSTIHHVRRRYAAAVAVCAIIVAVGVGSLYVHNEARAATPVYCQTPESEDGDWSNFAEADLFLENMNW